MGKKHPGKRNREKRSWIEQKQTVGEVELVWLNIIVYIQSYGQVWDYKGPMGPDKKVPIREVIF